MALFKKYDLVHEYGKETYCLLNDPEVKRIGNYDYYKAKAVEILFTVHNGNVPVYVIDWMIRIDEKDIYVTKVVFDKEYIQMSKLADIEPLKKRYEMIMSFHKKMDVLIKKYGIITYDNEAYIPIGKSTFVVGSWGYPVYFVETILLPTGFSCFDFPDEYGVVNTHDILFLLKDEYYEKWKAEGDKVLTEGNKSDIWDWNNPYDISLYEDWVFVDDLAND